MVLFELGNQITGALRTMSARTVVDQEVGGFFFFFSRLFSLKKDVTFFLSLFFCRPLTRC